MVCCCRFRRHKDHNCKALIKTTLLIEDENGKYELPRLLQLTKKPHATLCPRATPAQLEIALCLREIKIKSKIQTTSMKQMYEREINAKVRSSTFSYEDIQPYVPQWWQTEAKRVEAR
jgi:hypothetical protein